MALIGAAEILEKRRPPSVAVAYCQLDGGAASAIAFEGSELIYNRRTAACFSWKSGSSFFVDNPVPLDL